MCVWMYVCTYVSLLIAMSSQKSYMFHKMWSNGNMIAKSVHICKFQIGIYASSMQY